MNSKAKAFQLLIDNSIKAVKYTSSNAANKHFTSISGYVCIHCGYDTDNLYALNKKWNDDKSTKSDYGLSPNIFRIDRLIKIGNSYVQLESRYPCIWGSKESYANRKNLFYYLTDSEIENIQFQISDGMRNLGFVNFEVRIVSKQFYYYVEDTKNGLFGLKNLRHKKDDGIGKVVYISASW